MRFEGKKSQLQVLFVQDEIKADKKHENIQQRIRPAAGRIAECLQRHDPAKRRIKEIDDGDDIVFSFIKCANIISFCCGEMYTSLTGCK